MTHSLYWFLFSVAAYAWDTFWYLEKGSTFLLVLSFIAVFTIAIWAWIVGFEYAQSNKGK